MNVSVWKRFLLEEDGIGVVEIILILVVKYLTSSTYILSY